MGSAACFLELTPEGKVATGADVEPRDKLKVRFKLAIEGIPPFKALYEAQKGNRLPATSVLEDLAKEKGILKDPDSADNPVSTYYPNLSVKF